MWASGDSFCASALRTAVRRFDPSLRRAEPASGAETTADARPVYGVPIAVRSALLAAGQLQALAVTTSMPLQPTEASAGWRRREGILTSAAWAHSCPFKSGAIMGSRRSGPGNCVDGHFGGSGCRTIRWRYLVKNAPDSRDILSGCVQTLGACLALSSQRQRVWLVAELQA